MTDYTTVEALREFGDFESHKEDTTLIALVKASTRVIDVKCGRKFSADEETDRVFRLDRRFENAFEGPVLYLDEDLAEAASAITGTPTVTYVPENIPPYFAIVLTEGSWEAVVTVTGYWAYSRTPPEDIELAALSLANWFYEKRDEVAASDIMVTPKGRILIAQGLPNHIEELLKPYVRIRFAK